MSFDPGKARDFVYGNGTLFERALFDYLFDGGSAERVEAIILCYKNLDNGFGHGFEHDLKVPQSNPLALEWLLWVMKFSFISPNLILDGVADWVETQMDSVGNLMNPPESRAYHMAPWWQDKGGQTMPDSIVGNLMYFGSATPSLVERTKSWVAAHHTLESIRANEWLFIAYHAADFFFEIDNFPNLDAYQQATIDNIVACAEAAPENQSDSLFRFAPTPDSVIAKALPDGLVERFLDVLSNAQQKEGHWVDEHNLPQWYPWTTINVLLTLKRYGRWG